MSGRTQYGFKDVLDVIFYEIGTRKPKYFFDTLKTSGLEVTNETVYAKGGRGNAKLIAWDLSKEGKMTIEDAVFTPATLELVSGLIPKEGTHTMSTREKHVVDNAGKIKLKHTPSINIGDMWIYEESDDLKEEIKKDGVNLADASLTVGANYAGKYVIVYYDYDSTDKAITNVIDAKHFAGTYRMVGRTVVKNRMTGLEEACQVEIPRLKFSSSVQIGFAAEGDPATFNFECEILKDTETDDMVRLTIDEDQE